MENSRFWSKVNKTDSCWLWTAGKDNNGYPRFWCNQQMVPAYRVSYQELRGPIPPGLQLDHLCRTPLCVNPSHLEAVTQQENIARGQAGIKTGRKNASKTHCKNGHEFTLQNLYVYKDGHRACRVCRAAWSADWEKNK